MQIPITLNSDEKGYFDRECPNEECLYKFKIKMSDWKDKVSDEEVHCPMCGHMDTSEKWWTQEQLEAMQEIAASYALNYIEKELDKSFSKLARSTRHNKFVKITYKKGKRTSFINNPIGQSEEWETELKCSVCETEYSVIGTAYFCPCCGHNNIESAMKDSLCSVEKMINSLDEMENMLIDKVGKDVARNMVRSMLEGSLGDVISSFQKYAESVYTRKSRKITKVNDFQIVEKGSKLFSEEFGYGYEKWLTNNELKQMNLLFQRRHLLEHNGGIVDDRYIDKSGDTTYVKGQRIVMHKEDAIELIRIVTKLCDGLQQL